MKLSDLFKYGFIKKEGDELKFLDTDNLVYFFYSSGGQISRMEKAAKVIKERLTKQNKDIWLIDEIPKQDTFMVVDVETANKKRSSICQIGIAVYKNGQLIDKWESLVNPQCEFEDLNTYIHGIKAQDVAESPTIDELAEFLADEYFSKYPAYSYGSFETQAFDEALPYILDIDWVDITRIVRRTWLQFARKGYNLAQVAAFLNLENPHHHNALNDAVTAGNILLRALEHSGTTLAEWDTKIHQKLPDTKETQQPENTNPNPDGAFAGKLIAFTGTLSLPRVHLEQIAMQNGFEVKSNVTKKTHYLVNGIQTAFSVKDGLSSKFKKAIELQEAGAEILILSEQDFFDLIEQSDQS